MFGKLTTSRGRGLVFAAAAGLFVACPAARGAGVLPPAAAAAPAAAETTLGEVIQLAIAAYPDPALTATWWPRKASERKQETWELMLEQSLPFPGKLGAAAKVRDAEESLARIGLERTRRDVTLRGRESAVEIGYLRRARAVAAGNRELLGRLRAAGEAGYASDRTRLFDALRAQAQQSQTVFDEQLLAELESTEVARLNSLLGRPTETAVGPIDLSPGRPLAASLAQIEAAAASGRQEVRLARQEAEKARAERRVSGLETLPEFMLGVGYMQESPLEEMEGTSRWRFQLGLSLPVFFGKNAARRAEAGAGEARAAAM